MIAQRDLSIISNRLLEETGGRRIPEQSIELDYALGWFLAKLSQHPYGDRLAFKGGTALRRCHLGEYRFSEDLDFTLLNEDDFDTVTKAFGEVAASVTEETGMAFAYQRPDRNPHENSHTFYMTFTGPMGRAREFKVDVTRTESVVAELERRPVIVTYPAYDFPENCAVKVYGIDEIVAEKLLALTDPKRTQPRDLFDVWTLATNGDFGLDRLAYAIAQKLQIRGRGAEDLSTALDKKEKALEKTWSIRLDAQMSATPKFEGVFREVRAALRKARLFDLVLDARRALERS